MRSVTICHDFKDKEVNNQCKCLWQIKDRYKFFDAPHLRRWVHYPALESELIHTCFEQQSMAEEMLYQFRASLSVDGKLLPWSASWRSAIIKKIDYPETTILWEVQAMWRGPEERDTVVRCWPGTLSCCLSVKKTVCMMVLPSHLPQLTPHGSELPRWILLEFLTLKIMSKK